MINIKRLDPNKINMEKNSFKNILSYYIGYVTIKNLSYIKINSVNFLNLKIDKINGFIEENNEYIYMTIIPADESKDLLEKHKELWNNIRDLIRTKTNNSDK